MTNTPQDITLLITRKPDGKVSVSGPIGDKVICFGLLEVAHEIIKNFDPTKQLR